MVAQTRRGVAASLAALIATAPVLATAGIAGSVIDSVPTDPDAELLSLRGELNEAVADASHWNTVDHCPDAELSRSGRRLSEACWAIVDMPPAKTPAGWALKAAASLHQLRFSYGGGSGWSGDGEEMAWNVLRELAGDAYLPVEVPEYARSSVPA